MAQTQSRSIMSIREGSLSGHPGTWPVIDFSSGYVKCAEALLPSQGDRHPWRVPQNYVRDLLGMSLSRIDEALTLKGPKQFGDRANGCSQS